MLNLINLQKQLGYSFKNISILKQALTHRSFSRDNYERLEFVGDGILDYVIAINLYLLYPDLPEGKLSKIRAALVNQEALVEIAEMLQVGNNLLLGEGEENTGGRSRKSILADSVEAIIAAISLDSSFIEAKAVIEKLYAKKLKHINEIQFGDDKSLLQEYLQAKKMSAPIYSIVSISGPDHDSTFTVKCELVDLNMQVIAVGKTKKEATQLAASNLLKSIKERNIIAK